METTFKIGDIVAHKKHKTIGIVRDNFDDGELRTDADGVVSISELEMYNSEKHKDYTIAPSTEKEISQLSNNKLFILNSFNQI